MTIDENIKKKVKKFLEKYAQEHGQPDPSQKYARKIAIDVRSSGEIVLLPTYASYRSVHDDFVISVGDESNLKSLKYEAFRRLWHELTPHIKFMKPRTDLCDACHKFKTEIHSCKEADIQALRSIGSFTKDAGLGSVTGFMSTAEGVTQLSVRFGWEAAKIERFNRLVSILGHVEATKCVAEHDRHRSNGISYSRSCELCNL